MHFFTKPSCFRMLSDFQKAHGTYTINPNTTAQPSERSLPAFVEEVITHPSLLRICVHADEMSFAHDVASMFTPTGKEVAGVTTVRKLQGSHYPDTKSYAHSLVLLWKEHVLKHMAIDDNNQFPRTWTLVHTGLENQAEVNFTVFNRGNAMINIQLPKITWENYPEEIRQAYKVYDLWDGSFVSVVLDFEPREAN